MLIKELFEKGKLKLESTTEEISNSGKFKVITYSYSFIGEQPRYRCLRYEFINLATNIVILDIFPNSNSDWYKLVNHANGREYAFCGHDEDYQGYVLINLTDKKVYKIISPGAENGWGWIWTKNIYISPDSQWVASYGCYWGAPYGIQIYDFFNPDHSPLPVVFEFRDTVEDDVAKVIGWKDNIIEVEVDGDEQKTEKKEISFNGKKIIISKIKV